MMRSLRWRVALGLFVVFLAGAASGFLASAWQTRQKFDKRHRVVLKGDRMMRHFQRHLELTPEQRQKVEPIFDQTAARLQEIRAETGRRVSETMEQSRREIAPHLTPEQRVRMEEMKERRRRKIHRRRGRREPPPDEMHERHP